MLTTEFNIGKSNNQKHYNECDLTPKTYDSIPSDSSSSILTPSDSTPSDLTLSDSTPNSSFVSNCQTSKLLSLMSILSAMEHFQIVLE